MGSAILPLALNRSDLAACGILVPAFKDAAASPDPFACCWSEPLELASSLRAAPNAVFSLVGMVRHACKGEG